MLCCVITVSSARLGFFPLFFQSTSEPAMKILEKVPVTTPASSTKAKEWIAPPPNRNSDPAASRVVPEVMIVRLSVLLMARS